MGQVHDLLGVRGKLEALKAAEFDRREIEAAAAHMSDEDSGIGFLYSGWCQAALPHKRLPDNKGWQIKTDRVTLIVEPGMRPGLGEEPEHIGVPFGSRARLIMLYLQSEALRTRSREVELGKSLRGWLLRMGISVGGKSVDAVREQAERISRCRLSFHLLSGKRAGNFKVKFLMNLKLALAVYPDAKVDVDERGLILHPSRPPVAPKVKVIG